MLVVFMAWVQRVAPGVDELVVNFFRLILYRGLVRRKSSTGLQSSACSATGQEDWQGGISRRVRWGMYPWALFEVIFMSVVICRQRYHGRRYSHAWLQVLEFSGRRARALRREV